MIWPFSLLRKKKKPVQPRAVIFATEHALVGELVNFTAPRVGDVATHRWEFEPGVTAWGPGPLNAVHRYEKPGTYIVSLVVIGPTAMVSEAVHFITVRAK